MNERYELLSRKLSTPIEDIKQQFNTLEICNETEYRNSQSILRFRCNVCETEFEKRVVLLKKSGCPACKAKSSGKSLHTTQIFNASPDVRKNAWIEKCKEIHPGLFRYDKVNYVNKETKVIVGCNKCGNDFEILPCQISGSRDRKIVGCPSCNCKQRGLDRALSKDEILKRINKIWNVVDWQDATCTGDYIRVICKECGNETLSCINNLVKNMGCVTCYNKRRGDSLRFSQQQIISKFVEYWNDEYDYTKVNYINMSTPVIVTCKIHGEFNIVPHEHERGQGCSECRMTSEKRVLALLKQYFPDIVHQYKLDNCKKLRHLPFDYYIPSRNIVIELDGDQHFRTVSIWRSSVEQQIERDVYIMKIAEQSGMRIIRIYQPDVYRKSDNWVIETLLQSINADITEHSYLSINPSVYGKHKELMITFNLRPNL